MQAPTHAREWFDDCDIESATFKELLEQVQALPHSMCTVMQNMACNHMEKIRRHVENPHAFVDEEMLPADL